MNLRRIHAKTRNVFLLQLGNLEEFPDHLNLPCPRFVLLLSADFQGSTDSCSLLAAKVLDAGCVYFCAWGPGCENMHDLVDDAIIEREAGRDAVRTIMTTWHSSEPLADAVEFALFTAEPDEGYSVGCDAVVLAVSNNDAWGVVAETTTALLMR
jgi:hypothetical protein